MNRILRSPRWWVGHLLAVTVCALFVNLGFWQVRRLEERRVENAVLQNRQASAPMPIGELLTAAGADVDSLENRNADAVGTFDPQAEVLVRSQVHDGVAGFHVITPLVLDDGRALLVNRGWVPLDMDSVPVPVPPPGGEIEVRGWIRLTQVRSSIGTTEPEGILTHVARVDIDRLSQQMEYPLLPVYLVLDPGPEAAADFPIPVGRPDATDEGPHLFYAIQWFSFTLIGAVGYVLLLRRAAQRSQTRVSETLNDREPLDRR